MGWRREAAVPSRTPVFGTCSTITTPPANSIRPHALRDVPPRLLGRISSPRRDRKRTGPSGRRAAASLVPRRRGTTFPSSEAESSASANRGYSMRITVAALQLNSGDDKAANIAEAEQAITAAARAGARLVVLPELWTYLGPQEGNQRNAEPIPGLVT